MGPAGAESKPTTCLFKPSIRFAKSLPVIYDETIDYDWTKLWSSPNPTVVRGNIDPANLPMGKVGGVCRGIYPHEHLKVNTIFEVVHAAGHQTAYTDKHPAYDLVRGPSGSGLSVGYFPEIQSFDSKLPCSVLSSLSLLCHVFT